MRLYRVILKIFALIVSVSLSLVISAQANESAEVSTRFFMPALQIGYINHNNNIISDGLVIQTSLEYRTKNNLIFRINYDDFSGRISINDVNNNQYTAKVPLSELLGGIGYRIQV